MTAFNEERKRLLFEHFRCFDTIWSKPTLKAFGKYQLSFTIITLKTFCKKDWSDITWREVAELDFLIKKAWIIEINAETLLNHGWLFWKHQQYGNSSDRLIPSRFYFFPSLLPFLILIITLWYKSNIMTFISFQEIFGVTISNISMESNLAKIELTQTQSWL